jgi:prevent-host-death family protein
MTTARSSKGAEQARKDLPAILDDAVAGKTTIITRHGHPVAAVVPITTQLTKPASLLALAGSGKGLWGPHSAATLAALRDEWNR